jgi:hypothetical protein
MPVDLIAFTADRRISGVIPLADDRLSDMLNSVPRVVIRGAMISDLSTSGEPRAADLTLAVGAIVAVVASGRRGSDTRRRRTDVRRTRIGLMRFVVTGLLHEAEGDPLPAGSSDPAVVLAGRDILVPITDATITYNIGDVVTTEQYDTILINRALATWIDLDDAADDTKLDAEIEADREKVYHASYVKDFTGGTV